MEKLIVYLCLTCTINGFRRAGVAHSRNKTYYAADYFSPEQRKQLDAEPRITVTELAEVPEGAVIIGQARGAKPEALKMPADGTLSPAITGDADGSANNVESSTADAAGAPNQVDQAAAPGPDSADAPAPPNQVDVVTTADQVKPLSSLTVKVLRDMAQDAGIEQFSSMNKADLVEALQAVLNTGADTIPTGAAE